MMKYEILTLLREAAPDYVSGAELGERFGFSRTAAWKYIKELRAEGYTIEAASRKGYRLIASDGPINSFEIENDLGTSIVGREVLCYDALASTNVQAARLAAEGCVDGLTVMASRQTQGRGRLGRSWESTPDKGIYLSIVLRPPMAPAETQIFTLAAAVAAVRAIYGAAGLETGIKWPNDIVAGGKKLCGILLEMNCETDRVNYIVLGIGINYSHEASDFPDELQDRATSVLMELNDLNSRSACTGAKDNSGGRLALIRALLREMDAVLLDILDGKNSVILDMWREYSATIGKEVRFTLRDVEYTGTAIDITEDGRLLVDCSDGIRRGLISGEVSVRGMYGYI
ncbi:MAG: biotin--[acetyl-CoA-carboxylase] ligase [Clostridiaceae bacterium]|jgi:BirA family biotin operon repressor/biotin-[acetyl-CoA-carboxylase] ligase|nr:biotin--[acetyl-CoA-carboxylase] ligase [Clostridiaceae bacterium]